MIRIKNIQDTLYKSNDEYAKHTKKPVATVNKKVSSDSTILNFLLDTCHL